MTTVTFGREVVRRAGREGIHNAGRARNRPRTQPDAHLPDATYDPTPDTNVPLRGHTSFQHSAQSERAAALKGQRARNPALEQGMKVYWQRCKSAGATRVRGTYSLTRAPAWGKL